MHKKDSCEMALCDSFWNIQKYPKSKSGYRAFDWLSVFPTYKALHSQEYKGVKDCFIGEHSIKSPINYKIFVDDKPNCQRQYTISNIHLCI